MNKLILLTSENDTFFRIQAAANELGWICLLDTILDNWE